jgi:hypothetical protein
MVSKRDEGHIYPVFIFIPILSFLQALTLAKQGCICNLDMYVHMYIPK